MLRDSFLALLFKSPLHLPGERFGSALATHRTVSRFQKLATPPSSSLLVRRLVLVLKLAGVCDSGVFFKKKKNNQQQTLKKKNLLRREKEALIELSNTNLA